MSLFYFQGLNCYSSSMLNAAALTGVGYRNVFANLWSETDFTYDQIHHLYLSRRVPANLEALGVKLEFLNCCSPEEVEKSLSRLSNEQWMVVGMDAFFIPWTPYYRTLHSSHYFIARKKNGNTYSCFDPTYDGKNMELTKDNMISHIVDICWIYKTAGNQFHISIRQEVQEILYSHPKIQENLLVQIKECAYGKHKNGELLAKYIDALINNRYLYVHYLQSMSLYRGKYDQYFSKEFFQKWVTVKYGLYKASIRQSNQEIIREVCGHFGELIREEMDIAQKIGTTI